MNCDDVLRMHINEPNLQADISLGRSSDGFDFQPPQNENGEAT